MCTEALTSGLTAASHLQVAAVERYDDVEEAVSQPEREVFAALDEVVAHPH